MDSPFETKPRIQDISKIMQRNYDESGGNRAKDVAARVSEQLIDHVKQLFYNQPNRFDISQKPFRMIDYGCATGGAAVMTFKPLIKVMRNDLGCTVPIEICLNDLPDNHFDIAMKVFRDAMNDFKDIRVTKIEKSFLEQVSSPQSVDIGIAIRALQIISSPPCDLERGIYFVVTTEILEHAWAKQWESAFLTHCDTFMKYRMMELTTTGILIVVNAGNREPLSDYSQKEIVFHQAVGDILQQILAKHSLSHCYYSLLKTTCHMKLTHYASVLDKYSELIVYSLEVVKNNDPFYEYLNSSSNHDKLATLQSAAIQEWWGHVIESGLQVFRVKQEVIKSIMEELFVEQIPKLVKETIADYPEAFDSIFVTVKKVPTFIAE